MSSIQMMLPAMEHAMRAEKAMSLGVDSSVVVKASDYKHVEKAAGKPLPVPQEPENSDEEAEGEETELVAQLNASLEQEESTATTTGCVSKRPREDAVPAESKRKKKQLPKQESVNDVVADAGGAPIDTETDEAGNASDASVPSAGDKRKSDANTESGTKERPTKKPKSTKASGRRKRRSSETTDNGDTSQSSSSAEKPKKKRASTKARLNPDDSAPPQRSEFGKDLLKKNIPDIRLKITQLDGSVDNARAKLHRVEEDARKYKRLLRYKLDSGDTPSASVSAGAAKSTAQVSCAVQAAAAELSSSEDSEESGDDADD